MASSTGRGDGPPRSEEEDEGWGPKWPPRGIETPGPVIEEEEEEESEREEEEAAGVAYQVSLKEDR